MNGMTRSPTDGAGGPRVVVVGATGNVGTSVMRAFAERKDGVAVTGLARRLPAWRPEGTAWVAADIDPGGTALVPHFRGADAIVHLAWRFQPTHDPVTTWRTNVLGSIRVFEAAAEAGVPVVVHASSVGAYSPGPKDRFVDESWPTHGWPRAAYCREKAYLERYLDAFALSHPGIRVVRMRPGFLFKRESASQQRRLFAGPLLHPQLVRHSLVPAVPDLPGLRFQALHTDDAAAAYVEAVMRPVHGAFNLAADPPLDAAALARLLDARPLRTPLPPLRVALSAAWRLRLAPASPDLLDAVLRLPLMDCSRARATLDWEPRHTAEDALRECLEGMHARAGMDTAPLAV